MFFDLVEFGIVTNCHCCSCCMQGLASSVLTFFFSHQIKLSDRFCGDKGRSCLVTVDSTNCPIWEPRHPFSKTWHSHKLEGAGSRCKVGICIQTGDLVWINGPFRCGTLSDLKMFRQGLKGRLRPGEMVGCNGTCRGDVGCRNKCVAMNLSDLRAKNGGRSRHETVNGDMKIFDCLKMHWRHERSLHRCVFGAAVFSPKLLTTLTNANLARSLVDSTDGVV